MRSSANRAREGTAPLEAPFRSTRTTSDRHLALRPIPKHSSIPGARKGDIFGRVRPWVVVTNIRANTITELALLLALATLWGASYTFIKIGVETIPPITLIAS